MILVVLEKVKPSLRGDLSRWLMEVSDGVFLGRVSALVRDRLWDRACRRLGEGGVIMIHPWSNEQGFLVRQSGNLSRDIIDIEGLCLVRRRFKVAPPSASLPDETADT